MKVIIFGSRHMQWKDYDLVDRAVKASGFSVLEVVSGQARGADTMGEKWAFDRGIPRKLFPADWETHGKAAGPIRNMEMGDYADAGIGFIWDGSRGSAHMAAYLQKLGKPCYLVYNGEIHD